ncbi:hypothetical protein GCG54_00015298 [Colletotrichum gloeosporioides]|uniref:Nephrocystin 3-like N-terminal domain-containing protein n=1 Tax=Colletotrichum gloeosporioides TaxID=474922 RepID=A0A8H4C8I2_COLGL|nr:uncharacterized protein GCG54_00015298 [Colletotrichum gloeosporioides]KAF3799118.1 hypothetical protein GCG54_00015298 [Colletotrichum gloeosporioides]
MPLKSAAEAVIGKPDFKQALAAFYADILQFHKHAYSFVRRESRFGRRFENILDDMKRHEELTRKEIKSWREESLAQVQKCNDKQANKQYESIITWSKSEESDQSAILNTISADGARFAGTCSIKFWLQKTPESPVLWLQGTPGSGKGVLASQIVRFMRSANMLPVHHFCTHRYASSTTYEQKLRSILLQLLCKDDELIAYVYGDCVLRKKPPTVQALERLIYAPFNISSRQPRETEYI